MMRSIILFAVLMLLVKNGCVSEAQSNWTVPFQIAYNNGSVAVGFRVIMNGLNDGINFFISTFYPDNVSPNCKPLCVYEVKMGEFTDWLIPAVDTNKTNSSTTVSYSSFSVLGGGIRHPWIEDQGLRSYTYSPVSPFSKSFNGLSRLVPNYFAISIYGSSPKNFVKDGARDRLIAWGSYDSFTYPFDPTDKGGCCWLNRTDRYGFGKAYNITGHNMSLDFLYFHVISSPTFYYKGQRIGVKAVVADIFMRTNVPEAVSNWTLESDDKPSEVVEANGTATFSAMLESPINESKTVQVLLTVNLTSPGKKTFWYTNATSNTANFSVKAGVEIISPWTPIDFKAPITKMLRFTTWNDTNAGIPVECGIDHSVALDTSFFGSIADLTPNINELMETADKKYVETWKNITAADGIFGANVSNDNTFQYFAFAIYNPVNQTIPIAINCSAGAFCFVYLNGTLYDNAAPYPSPNLVYPMFEAGMYQVIVKFASVKANNSGFQLSFEASGLAFNEELQTSMPFIAPANYSEKN